MIHRCAIGVITGRGKNVIAPTLSELTAGEQDYLSRHDEELRGRHADENAVFCTFKIGSSPRTDLTLAQRGSEDAFLEVAVRMVDALATAMRGTTNAKDCVVALLAGGEPNAKSDHLTFLKLDARIEAAHLKKAQAGRGVRLEVFKDLLPAPGEMQKGFSWPDPRHPASDLILHDTNRGDAALYFGNAFSLNISSKALETENALTDELVRQLGPARAREAAALVNDDGGRADRVVAKIRESYPEFTPTERALGGAGALAGLVVVADPVKDNAAEATAELSASGIRIIMMTGDNQRTADAVARKVGGIDEVLAGVLPQQKQALVERLRGEGRRVGMAGDGINDAPALAAADVGIAMGTGTDVAMESAAVTLLRGDLAGIVRARHLSRAVMRNIRQNLFFSFVFNAAGVPIAAGVLYPAFGILLSPIIAGAAMAFSSVAVIGNSLRLNRARL